LVDQVLNDYPHTDMEGRGSYDQNFLFKYVWPLVKGDTISHDIKQTRCRRHGPAQCKPYPIGPSNVEENYFVGAGFQGDNWNQTHECELKCKLNK
jgi:hypothetical protein